jgi:peroxiredoxin family protein
MLETDRLTEDAVRQLVREEIQRAFKKDPARKNLSMVASKGTLDWAYPPLILATAGAAANMDAAIFFTFYGLNIIHKDFEKKLLVAPTGNPAMPMPVPMPDVITGMPGMKAFATGMMKSMFSKKGVATIKELLDVAVELEVRLIACQMTMDVFGYEESDFLDGVEFGGAAAFLSDARKSHVTLFI